MKYMANGEDFGCLVTAAMNMYCREKCSDTLYALYKAFSLYMGYLDDKTILNAVRSLQPANTGYIPEDGRKIYGKLIELCTAEYLNRYVKAKVSEHTFTYTGKGDPETWDIIMAGRNMECISDNAAGFKAYFESATVFLSWAQKHRKEPVKSEGPISVNSNFTNDFNIICLNAVKYAADDEAYLARIISEFVSSNEELLRKEVWKEILETIKNSKNTSWKIIRRKEEKIC